MENFLIQHGPLIASGLTISGILWRKFWIIDAKFDSVNKKIDDLSKNKARPIIQSTTVGLSYGF